MHEEIKPIEVNSQVTQMFELGDKNFTATIINVSEWKRRTKWMTRMGILKKTEKSKKNQI